jgi:hypothetical protein
VNQRDEFLSLLSVLESAFCSPEDAKPASEGTMLQHHAQLAFSSFLSSQAHADKQSGT